jgi:hypothetical protein
VAISSVAGRAFDDPGPFGVDAVAIDQLDGVAVAVCGGWEPAFGEHARRAGVDDREGDPIAVGIDADDVMDEFCKHDGGTSECGCFGRCRSGRNRYARTVMGHTVRWTGF